MNTYRVEFMNRNNHHFIVETIVTESSIEKVESCACQWLFYWMGLNSSEFKITIKA